MSHCAEYVNWMESNGGIKLKHRFVLYDCNEEYGNCRGCKEYDTCDSCGIGVCLYLARYVDDEFLCPECWESIGCPQDDRDKEDYGKETLKKKENNNASKR